MSEVQSPREAVPPASPAEVAENLFIQVSKDYPASATAQGLAVLQYCRSQQISPVDLEFPLFADHSRLDRLTNIANGYHSAARNRKEKERNREGTSGNGEVAVDDAKRVSGHAGQEPPTVAPQVSHGETMHVLSEVFANANNFLLLPDEEVGRLLSRYPEFHWEKDGVRHRDERGYRNYVAKVVKDNSPQGFKKR